MAKNDFTPIVFKILAKLYINLKEDKKNDASIFDKEKYGISFKYMDMVIFHLIYHDYVDGIQINDYGDHKRPAVFVFDDVEIRPKGIHHLEDIVISEKKEKLFPYDINEYEVFH